MKEVKVPEERIAQAHRLMLEQACEPFEKLRDPMLEDEQENLRSAVFQSFSAVRGVIEREKQKIKKELNYDNDSYIEMGVYGELQLVSTAFNIWLHGWNIEKVPVDSLYGEKIGEFAVAVGELMTRYAVNSIQHREAWDCDLGWVADEAIESDAREE